MTAAAVEICESNGGTPDITHNIGDLDCGNTDAANLDPTAYPVPVGENAYEKKFRVHVTLLNDSNKVKTLKVWKSNGDYVTDEGIQTNVKESGYSAHSYTAPSKTTYTNVAMPIAEPSGANLGIGGSLSGEITGDDSYSDYVVMQRQSGAGTPPGDANSLTISIKYTEE